MKILLSEDQKTLLEERHRKERDGRIKDRIKAMLHRSDGRNIYFISLALRICESTVLQHLKDFVEENKLKPENGGDLDSTVKRITRFVA